MPHLLGANLLVLFPLICLEPTVTLVLLKLFAWSPLWLLCSLHWFAWSHLWLLCSFHWLACTQFFFSRQGHCIGTIRDWGPVHAWSVQWRSPVAGYALYTSPPEKKRRAQRCHQMNRTGPFRLVLGRRRVRPYGFRMSELGWKNKENEIRNLLRRPVLRGLKVCLSTEESATPWVTRSQSKVSEWIVFLMKEDLVTKQSPNNHKIIVRIMKEFWKSIPSVETRLSCFLSVNQLIYLH